MSETGNNNSEIPENVIPIRKGVTPKPNTPPQPENQGRRKLLQSALIVAGGLFGAKVLGELSNKLVEPDKPLTTQTSDNKSSRPMRAYSQSSQYPPTPTAEDKLASEQYRQRQAEISKNPDDPGSRIEGIQYPKSTATPYPNTPAHKVK